MRVHTKTTIDMETGATLLDAFYEYGGPLVLCAGEGDPAPPDAAGAQEIAQSGEDRRAAALDAFRKEPEAPADAGASETSAKEPPSAAAEPGKEPVAEGETPIEKAAFFSDPVFQEYHKTAQADHAVVEGFHDILTQGRYAIKDAEQMKLVHNDAFMLYDIADGKMPATQLLDVFKANWKPEQFQQVLQELANYAANAGVEGKKGEPNPLEERLSKMERGEQERAKAEQHRQQTEQHAKVVDSLEKELTRLCVEKGLVAGKDATAEQRKAVEEERQDFIFWVSSELGKNPDAVKQLEKGQFGETQRLFAQRFNALVERAKRYADGKIVSFETRQRETPRQPGAGGGDRGGKRERPNLADGDQRRKLALEQFKAGAGN